MAAAMDEYGRMGDKIRSGDLRKDEPCFVLRARDVLASAIVREWAQKAREAGTPEEKCVEAEQLADAMDKWPSKQVPGRDDTRITA